jgi:hypothetical protein
MKNPTVLIITLFLCFLMFSLAFADEQITITAYYPSPYGVYKTFRIYPSSGYCSQGAVCTADQEGEICENGADHTFYTCSGSPLIWDRPGWWKLNSISNPNYIYNENPTGFIKVGPVYIGAYPNVPAPAFMSNGNSIGVRLGSTGGFEIMNSANDSVVGIDRFGVFWTSAAQQPDANGVSWPN